MGLIRNLEKVLLIAIIKKLILAIKHLKYIERLQRLKLTKLRFRCICGNWEHDLSSRMLVLVLKDSLRTNFRYLSLS